MSQDFAVIQLNGRQYLVSEGDKLTVDHIASTEFSVLLANLDGKEEIGEPELKEVGVELVIIEEGKDKKIHVRRYKSKSRYRKNKGHRQPISILEVKSIKKGIKNKISKNLKVEEASASDIKKAPVVKEKIAAKHQQSAKDIGFEDLKLTPALRKNLQDGGFDSIEKIKKASKEELLALKGVGEKALEKIYSQLK